MFDPKAEFNDYVFSFYGKGGIYDYDFTLEEIETAKNQYIESGADFQGDSLDREKVRDIVIENRQKLR